MDERGKLTLVEVTSITTEEPVGNKAKMTFQRKFTPDETLLAKVEACKLEKPQVGDAELTWNMTRDDDGKWSIAK